MIFYHTNSLFTFAVICKSKLRINAMRTKEIGRIQQLFKLKKDNISLIAAQL